MQGYRFMVDECRKNREGVIKRFNLSAVEVIDDGGSRSVEFTSRFINKPTST